MSWLDGKELGQLLQRKLSRIRQTNNVLCAVHDSSSGKSKGFGFVSYEKHEDANKVRVI